jgi:tellurite resistance protein TerC
MHNLLSAVPVIISLVIIEGLLSIDNAMAIAAMASGLPERQQKKALRYGILGAYAMRGVCLACAAWIAGNEWIKAIGAAYLIWLMISHLRGGSDDDGGGAVGVKNGFWKTVCAIELLDLSLSLDNVVAAVALDNRLWVICTGVFVGILILRFIAGYCIVLIERFPVLKTTAFLLVGYVGALLLLDIAFTHLGSAIRVTSAIKFSGIFAITFASLIYGLVNTSEEITE